jgi:hypothetical protein
MVSVEASGFQSIVRQVSVETGTTTTADFALRVGDTQLRHSTGRRTADAIRLTRRWRRHHAWANREPTVNGRNFLELVKLNRA